MIKNRFKKILIPLDGSPNSIRGLNEAISLARQCNSTLIGVFVIPTGPQLHKEKFNTYRNHLIKLSKKFFKKAKTTAGQNGIEFQENLVYDNNLASAIAKFAKFKKCDLIVMGARGTSSPQVTWLGSVANGVLNYSQVPVLIVK